MTMRVSARVPGIWGIILIIYIYNHGREGCFYKIKLLFLIERTSSLVQPSFTQAAGMQEHLASLCQDTHTHTHPHTHTFVPEGLPNYKCSYLIVKETNTLLENFINNMKCLCELNPH